MTKTTKPMVYKHSNDSNSYATDVADIEVNISNKTNARSNPIKFGNIKRNDNPINQFKKNPTDVSAHHAAAPLIGAMAIDKLVLDIQLPEHELATVLERARQLYRARQLGRGSKKGKFYKNIFILRLPSKSVACFHMVQSNPDKGAPMQLVLNPNQMEPGDCKHLIAMFKLLFPLNAREIAALMLIRRIDVCIQLGLAIEDLIIELNGVMSGAKVYLKTDRDGKMQTIYMGSTESAHHGVAYDQITSDQYKRLVGEKPSRISMREDAELVLELERKQGRIQLESRRVFDHPVTLARLADLKTPFGKYRILQLKAGCKKWEPGFCGYVDSVRLRGVHGTRAHWKAQCGESREVMAQIAEFELRLGRMAAPWWNPEEYAASLLETLKKSAAWKFLRLMEELTERTGVH
jgi:hypothetical protein